MAMWPGNGTEDDRQNHPEGRARFYRQPRHETIETESVSAEIPEAED
jgi:hypothetical protein